MSLRLNVKDIKSVAENLSAGDTVLLCGIIYTARDAAHKRIFSLLDKGQKLPFNINGAVIYYAGPTPAKDDQIIGSCGPTTSGRMDMFTPRLLSLGLGGMIGKGERSAEVINAINQYKSVYFCAVGGAGALAAKSVQSCEVIAFKDLGCESVKRLEIKDFPVIVGIDCNGGNIFKTGREKYRVL